MLSRSLDRHGRVHSRHPGLRHIKSPAFPVIQRLRPLHAHRISLIGVRRKRVQMLRRRPPDGKRPGNRSAGRIIQPRQAPALFSVAVQPHVHIQEKIVDLLPRFRNRIDIAGRSPGHAQLRPEASEHLLPASLCPAAVFLPGPSHIAGNRPRPVRPDQRAVLPSLFLLCRAFLRRTDHRFRDRPLQSRRPLFAEIPHRRRVHARLVFHLHGDHRPRLRVIVPDHLHQTAEGPLILQPVFLIKGRKRRRLRAVLTARAHKPLPVRLHPGGRILHLPVLPARKPEKNRVKPMLPHPVDDPSHIIAVKFPLLRLKGVPADRNRRRIRADRLQRRKGRPRILRILLPSGGSQRVSRGIVKLSPDGKKRLPLNRKMCVSLHTSVPPFFSL